VAIALFDALFLDDTDGFTLKPASSFTWPTDLPTTQAAFIAKFCGLAGQRYDTLLALANTYGLKDGQMTYNRGGVFRFDTAVASYNALDLVGLAKQTGNFLENQKVALVATKNLAIGRVIRPTVNETVVDVEILPMVRAFLG